nr:hypothetical protein DVH24_004417 [Ipomoea batatas]GMC89509.1 hypothetical protein DVH24_004417 [Ipomoea batatas]GMC90776.1 hypothetical protein DVH24_004417 [Ipomoea batatas]
MIYDLKSGVFLEILVRSKKFNAKACYGWGKLLLFATMMILPMGMSYFFTQGTTPRAFNHDCEVPSCSNAFYP